MNTQDKFTLAVCALGILLCAVGLVGAWRMSKQHKAQNALAYELPDDLVPPPTNCDDCSVAYSILLEERERYRMAATHEAIENHKLNGRISELLSAAVQQEIRCRDIELRRDALDERLRRVYLDNSLTNQQAGVDPCKS